ncbi:hypothetical protein DXV76_04305 [Rhodobacteraceae bacterium CCMM004]|nr:hypothetical protein DXV76_04305 [Rhodobacteraceae bacterium CCMM004]
MARHDEISCDDLATMTGRPDAPSILDVRTEEDAGADPVTLPGAMRVRHDDAGGCLARASARGTVVVCHRGRKLSHGVAARLRDEGIPARVLAGGMVAWRAQGRPVTWHAAAHAVWVAGAERPDVACLWWAIRRYARPDARLLIVPAAEVADVAGRFAAHPLPPDMAALTGALGLDLPGPGAVWRDWQALDLGAALARLWPVPEARLAPAATVCDVLLARAAA